MNESLLTIYVFIFVGALEILMGLPLMYEKIKPNWLYGFRTPKTVNNEKIWYEVNKQTGRDFVISGMIIIIISLSLILFDFNLDVTTIALLQASVLIILIAIAVARGLLLIKKF